MNDHLTRSCVTCERPVIAGEAFCEACGAPISGAVPDHADLDLGTVAAVTDRGLLHAQNEDAFSIRRVGDAVATVVCDGVSASVGPDLAARVAAATAADALEATLTSRIAPFDAVASAVAEAQDAVGRLPFAPNQGLSGPACTLVSAVWNGSELTVGSVGDSRAYWISGSEATCLTVDHSWMQAQLDQGTTTESEAAADPLAHAITHWIGADAPAEPPRIVSYHPETAGCVVLCTDGLWNYMPSADAMADAVRQIDDPRPVAIARALVRAAIARGGHDNVTVAVIDVPARADTREEP